MRIPLRERRRIENLSKGPQLHAHSCSVQGDRPKPIALCPRCPGICCSTARLLRSAGRLPRGARVWLAPWSFMLRRPNLALSNGELIEKEPPQQGHRASSRFLLSQNARMSASLSHSVIDIPAGRREKDLRTTGSRESRPVRTRAAPRLAPRTQLYARAHRATRPLRHRMRPVHRQTIEMRKVAAVIGAEVYGVDVTR